MGTAAQHRISGLAELHRRYSARMAKNGLLEAQAGAQLAAVTGFAGNPSAKTNVITARPAVTA